MHNLISETLQSIYSEASNISTVSKSFSESSFPRGLNFEPQNHEYINREDEVYLKFYGPMSSGMEYFIEREKAYEKRITNLEKELQKKALLTKGFFIESLEPHYFLPTMTTASASVPV